MLSTSSKSSSIAVFLAAEIAVVVLARFRLRRGLVVRGMPYDRDQDQAVCEPRSTLRIAGYGQRMFTSEVPPRAILLDGELMAVGEMPSEHLATPATLQANDVIAVNGSPDRHSGAPLTLRFGCGFSESGECLMHSRDQGCELIGPDLVSPNICSNDIGSDFSIE